jgi:type VI secretion system protein VasD
MTTRYAPLKRLLAIVACVALAACAGAPPKPAKAQLSISASTAVNPDADGRPSPVVVRLYQLKDDAAFGGADFFAIFDKEEATLAASLLSREEFVLAPGDARMVELQVSPEARFLGVAAAFRDIRNAAWREVKPAPIKGFTDVVKRDALTIVVEQSRVTLQIAD